MTVAAIDSQMSMWTSSIGGVSPSAQPASSVSGQSTDTNSTQTTSSASLSSGGTFRTSSQAEDAAERLTYDQPSGRQNKALSAYHSVARQEKRDAIQQMLTVDLYA